MTLPSYDDIVVQNLIQVTAERDRLKEEVLQIGEQMAKRHEENKRLEGELATLNKAYVNHMQKADKELAEAQRMLGIIARGFHLLAHPSEGKFESCMWETCQEALAICHSTAKEGE